jgi:DNA-binding MarR family transcriptional regulator
MHATLRPLLECGRGQLARLQVRWPVLALSVASLPDLSPGVSDVSENGRHGADNPNGQAIRMDAARFAERLETVAERSKAVTTGETRVRVYTFVRRFIEHNGYAPSFREIADGVGLASLSSVFYHLESLENRGLLRRTPGRARSIVLRPQTRYLEIEPDKAATLKRMLADRDKA